MTYCTDTDLLHWEPNIFRDAAFASQLLLAGSGNLSGMAFSVAAGLLAANHVAAGQVIVLSGAISGSYPVVSVDSASSLTLSIMYDGLFPDAGAGEPSPVGSASGLAFAIRTFFPQRRVVSAILNRAAGIGGETDAPTTARIINTEAVRRPCVLGTLQMIYNALAAAASQPSELTIRAQLYERLYRRSLGQACVEIDLDGDGKAEAVRRLGAREMVRA
jgi:hypothetical protein